MFAELAFVFLTVFLLIVFIDKYSTFLLIFVCGILTYVVSSLWLKSISEYEEQNTSSSYFIKFLISAYSQILHVVFAVRSSYVYRKAKGIFFHFWQWFAKFYPNEEERKEAEVSPSRKKHCGLAPSLETELRTVIDKILHTYLRSWYCKLSQNTDFIHEVNYIIEDVFVSVGNGISRMDKKEFLFHLIQVYHKFFQHYTDALQHVKYDKSKGTLEKCISMKKEIAGNFKMVHWALKNPLSEWHYLQSFVARIIDSFGPVELMSSHLLQNVVTEVLTQNLMSPIVDLFSDPEQLNAWILKFLKGVAKEQNLPVYDFIIEHTQKPHLSAELEQHEENRNHVPNPKIVISSQISVSDEVSKTVSPVADSTSDQVCMSIGSVHIHTKSTPSVVSLESDSVSESSLNVSRSSSVTENSLHSPKYLAVTPRALSVNMSANELTSAGFEKDFSGSSNIRRSKSADCINEMPRSTVSLLPLSARNHSIRLSGKNNKTFVKFRANYSPAPDVEQAEEAVEAEVPHLFDDVRIIDTEQKMEPGHSPYTLYCIQYWGIFHDISSTASVPDLVRQRVNVRRRFREFLALQSRLEDIPELKSCLKGIKGPSKWLATPFSNLDKKNIAERKVFLENYLLELCKRNPIIKSTVLQEFLAYGGDASIAFVKKASDLNMPRIDKMIVRSVKGAIDMIKTALPNTPTPSEVGSIRDGDSEVFESADEETGSELKFQECSISFTKSDPEIVEKVEDFFKSYGLESSTESLYQTDLSPLDCRVVEDFFPPDQRRSSLVKFGLDDSEPNDDSKENPMTDAMIDLGVEVLQNIPRIFKTERLIFFVKNFFGPLLDVLTDVVLEVVLQKENCAAMLHILHKTVWPDPKPGSGLADASVDKGHLLNEAIREYIIEVYKMWTILLRPLRPVLSETLDLLLGSIQNKEMNKCLIFHVFDVIIHSLCSEDIKKIDL